MPTPQQKMVIVPHQPGRRRRFALLYIALICVTAVSSFYLGGFSMQQQRLVAIEELEKLSIAHQTLQASETSLRQRVANLESSQAVDAHAKQEIQATIRALKSELSQTQKDATFYRNIMAPADNAKGLRLENVEISELSQDASYAYKVVLTQVGDHRSYVSGVVAVNLIGQRNGEQEVIALRDVSDGVDDLGIKFRFRYFQDFAGELSLPEGFAIEQIQIVAQSKGKKASRIEQSFAWRDLLASQSS